MHGITGSCGGRTRHLAAIMAPGLEAVPGPAICLGMDYRRIRAIVLLLAFAFGIVGQTAAALAMPMGTHAPASSMTMPGGCSGCLGTADDTSLQPACALAFCVNLPTVATDGHVETPSLATYPLVASDFGPGISVAPDPGPPKPLHHR